MMPIVTFYAYFELLQNGKKTPKYMATKTLGNYPPMEVLKNKRGELCFYLMQRRSDKESAPPMYLQGKDSLNFTGIIDNFEDGKPSGYAYGYPYASATYGKDKTPNPFYEYRNDGYLFIVHQSSQPTPDAIELIVCEGGKSIIPLLCQQLKIGGFDDVLTELRTQIL